MDLLFLGPAKQSTNSNSREKLLLLHAGILYPKLLGQT